MLVVSMLLVIPCLFSDGLNPGFLFFSHLMTRDWIQCCRMYFPRNVRLVLLYPLTRLLIYTKSSRLPYSDSAVGRIHGQI